ncbi:MAG TPA: cyclase family protein [Thermoplasmata archaeon]|nr:cyclase family protein [Thermoplasmata archaeon]
MRPIDVSMPIFEGMPAFPGDPPFVERPVRRLARGEAYNLSLWSLGSHAGTHVDPPSHFRDGSPSIERLDLTALNGPCEVVQVAPDRPRVGVPELDGVASGTERVLLRTGNSPRWARQLAFFEDFVALSLDGAERLLRAGVRLVGIDALSVERDPSGRFPVHRRLLEAGVPILEGLLLEAAPAGTYRLGCLPLAVRGGDGGPSRAVLWPR